MEKSIQNGLPVFQFKRLSKQASIRHYVSTREGGVSDNGLSTFNLSYSVGDEEANVKANRKKLAELLDIKFDNLVFPQQTHGDEVGVVEHIGNTMTFPATDALITNLNDVCISVMSADCVTILLYDMVNDVIGAVHAGWKGTVSKILAKTVAKMTEVYGSDPVDIMAGIGPSISQKNFEVGPEVVVEFQKAFPQDYLKLVQPSSGNMEKSHIDLWEANRIILLKAGLLDDNIEIAGICTFDESNTFFSHRKNNQSGRFAAGIVLRK